MRAQQQQQVSVCQQSTLDSQPVHGLSRCIQPAVPTPQFTVPIHQPVMTKRVKPTSSLFTCTVARHLQTPCPTANGHCTCRPTSLLVPSSSCLCQSVTVTLCISNSNTMESVIRLLLLLRRLPSLYMNGLRVSCGIILIWTPQRSNLTACCVTRYNRVASVMREHMITKTKKRKTKQLLYLSSKLYNTID